MNFISLRACPRRGKGKLSRIEEAFVELTKYAPQNNLDPTRPEILWGRDRRLEMEAYSELNEPDKKRTEKEKERAKLKNQLAELASPSHAQSISRRRRRLPHVDAATSPKPADSASSTTKTQRAHSRALVARRRRRHLALPADARFLHEAHERG